MGAALRLRVLDGDYAVCRLSPSVDEVVVPPSGTGFWSLTEVGDERSLVCLEDLVDDDGRRGRARLADPRGRRARWTWG